MISLLKIFPDKWEQARGYLRLDLEAIEAAMNQRWSVTFGASNLLRSDTIAGDFSEDTRYISNEGTDHAPFWAQVNLSNGVKNRLPFANFVAATTASRLVGRGSSAGGGDFEEITLGSGLIMHGTSLSVNPAGFPIYDESYSSYDPWNTGGGLNTVQSITTGVLTPGRIPLVTTGGQLTDDAGITYDATDNRINVDQVRFPAAQNASADANTLDDYEEGDWTPTLTFGGGSTGLTYTTQEGTYTKIGRFVALCGLIQLSNKGSSTGNALITALPFASGNANKYFSSVKLSYSAFTAGVQEVGMQTIVGTTTANTVKSVAGTNTVMTEADYTNTSSLVIYISYFV